MENLRQGERCDYQLRGCTYTINTLVIDQVFVMPEYSDRRHIRRDRICLKCLERLPEVMPNIVALHRADNKIRTCQALCPMCKDFLYGIKEDWSGLCPECLKIKIKKDFQSIKANS